MNDVIESWLTLKHPLERHCLRAVVEDLTIMLKVSKGIGIVYAVMVTLYPSSTTSYSI